jgi:hypothetical protein
VRGGALLLVARCSLLVACCLLLVACCLLGQQPFPFARAIVATQEEVSIRCFSWFDPQAAYLLLAWSPWETNHSFVGILTETALTPPFPHDRNTDD